MAGGTLQIGRLRTTYLVTADHLRAERFRRFGDDIAARSLGEALAAALPRWLPRGDEGVWFLRRLETHVDWGLAQNPQRLAAAWAGEIARAMAAVMQDDSDGSNLLYFPNRPAYLAQFLADVASGRAWGKWYYQEFDGLRALPVSAALRTAICDDSETGLSALLLLGAPQLAAVLEALAEADALRVLDGIAARSRADLAGADLKETARAFVRFGRSTDRLAAAVNALRAATGDLTVSPAPATERNVTPFGGAFLLFPLLDELPLAEAVAGWPDPEGASAVSLVRFLVLAKCLGSRRAEQFFLDLCLRDLMGIPPALVYSAAARWMTRPSRANVHGFLGRLRGWHVETGAAEGRVLALAPAFPECGPTAIVMDCLRGVWLSGASGRVRSPGCVLEYFRDALMDAEMLLCDQAFLEPARSAFRRAQVRPIDGAAGIMGREGTEGLAGLRKPGGDLSYLALPRIPAAARAVDLALSVAAQGVMRTFAWRLPGFAGSSLSYLHNNFLDAFASIEVEASRRVVRLGRPPLHLVLSIAGMTRQSYRVRWLGTLPCELFPEG